MDLLPFVRNSIDATARGTLVDKTSFKARTLLFRMVENSQDFGSRTLNNNFSPNDNSIKGQVCLLSKMFVSLMKDEISKVASCGVCRTISHHNG